MNRRILLLSPRINARHETDAASDASTASVSDMGASTAFSPGAQAPTKYTRALVTAAGSTGRGGDVEKRDLAWGFE